MANLTCSTGYCNCIAKDAEIKRTYEIMTGQTEELVAARAEAAMLREALALVEPSVRFFQMETGSRCSHCHHLVEVEPRHEKHCPFYALSTPASDWLARHDAEILERSTGLKMYVWSFQPSWIAVAHAKSVTQARHLLAEHMGSGDGSCVMREKARTYIATQPPAIWIGPNCEFELTDSAELEEQEAYSRSLLTRAEKAEAERDGLAAALATAEATIKAAMLSASVNNLSAAGGRLAAYQMTGRDYPTILARIKADAKREALREKDGHDAQCDRHWIAGANFGWHMGLQENREEFIRVINARHAEIVAAAQAAKAAVKAGRS